MRDLAELVVALGLGGRPPKRVLLVEDSLPFARIVHHWLTESGHSVTHLVGADSLDGFSVSGTNAEGAQVTVNLNDIEVAFLDHDVLGILNGAELARKLLLVRPSLPIVGISGDTEYNLRILASGALAAVPKAHLRSWLGA